MYGSYTLVQYTKLLSDFIHVHTFGFQNCQLHCAHTLGFQISKIFLGKFFLKEVMATESFHSKGLKGLATLASGCHSGKFSVCVHIWV